MSIEVGLRVVRGPDWKWGNQDDGEGHVGTVIEVGRPGRKTSPDKTVVVQWDSGTRTNYRVGYQSAYDLRIFDNAQIGVKHQNILCNFCKEEGIIGMRWKCAKCSDFDLCTSCYMADKHDTNHKFIRFTNGYTKGASVPKRLSSAKIDAWGIFPNAKVERGPDWDWGNQDGGEGKVGKVLEVRGWENETYRSVANIVWQSSITNVYRVGHKGKVDLKYKTAADGGKYYRDHLPVLGDQADSQSPAAIQPSSYKIGDKVRVDLEPEVLKVLQDGHGGWNPKMAEYIGKTGTVHRITDRGDVRVQYEECPNRWTFNASALKKVYFFNVGDAVMINKDIDKVKESQKGHGEWTDSMKMALGKIGKVIKVYPDGDLRVCVSDQTWTFNPFCCQLKTHDQQEIDNTMASHERTDSPGHQTLLEQIMKTELEPSHAEALIKEAAQGHMDSVREILRSTPENVNTKSAGKTALQVASHQGNLEIVMLLLGANADLAIKDEDGDTALHYAAFGNQPEIMKVLLDHGAQVNEVNKGGCSTLHVAVNKQHLSCIAILLAHSCDVNIQDSYGDSALHDAIGKEDKDIIAQLVDCSSTEFGLRNKRGFNVLHHAALKGNDFAVQRILSRTSSLVDIKKEDGFAALHLAALNSHKTVAEVLIQAGKADIEVKNNRKQTPLLLAVSQGHRNVAEILLEAGADISAEDEDGDSCLHLALMRPANQQIEAQVNFTPVANGDHSPQNLGLITYLLERGADPMQRNRKGKSAFEVVSDSQTQEVLKKYVKDSVTSICMVCNDDPATIMFEPCHHTITCADCCIKMKKCLKCQTQIENKVGIGGAVVNGGAVRVVNEDGTVKELERRLQEMEESFTCSICLDRKRNVAFLCGHSACNECAQPLRLCHMCRKPITKRINLFQ